MKNRWSFSVVVFGIALLSFLQGACTPTSTQNKVIQLAIWPHYLAQEAIQEFESKTGYKIQVTNYASNEELLAKLQAGGAGYDLAVPSDYAVEVMGKLGLLEKIDRTKITHFSELNPKLLGLAFDPENQFSMPYDAGFTGIAVRKDLFKKPITGYKDLFELKEAAGQFGLLDDAREALGAAYKVLGMSLNSKDPAQLKKARDLLVSQKARVKAFSSDTLAGLTDGSLPIAQAYSTDALQAREATKGAVEFILPKEGYTLWIDNLVIPKGAKNIVGAHALIDFLLDSKVGVASVKSLFVSPANLKTLSLLPAEFKSMEAVVFTPQVLLKSEMMKNLGEFTPEVERAWSEVKASD